LHSKKPTPSSCNLRKKYNTTEATSKKKHIKKLKEENKKNQNNQQQKVVISQFRACDLRLLLCRIKFAIDIKNLKQQNQKKSNKPVYYYCNCNKI
jgi:hypothetical protein